MSLPGNVPEMNIARTSLRSRWWFFSAYFLHGSLEQFPTNEQQDKVYMVVGFGFAVFAMLFHF
jgi:hypothetical protein